MSSVDFEIQMDRRAFTPGEPIEARLVVLCESPTEARFETRLGYDVRRSGHRDYHPVERKVVLSSFDAGETIVPLRFVAPDWPFTHHGSILSVQWMVTAELVLGRGPLRTRSLVAELLFTLEPGSGLVPPSEVAAPEAGPGPTSDASERLIRLTLNLEFRHGARGCPAARNQTIGHQTDQTIGPSHPRLRLEQGRRAESERLIRLTLNLEFRHGARGRRAARNQTIGHQTAPLVDRLDFFSNGEQNSRARSGSSRVWRNPPTI